MRVKLNKILVQGREESEKAPVGLGFTLLTFFSLILSTENVLIPSLLPEENGLK
jgi:hypothetical protein